MSERENTSVQLLKMILFVMMILMIFDKSARGIYQMTAAATFFSKNFCHIHSNCLPTAGSATKCFSSLSRIGKHEQRSLGSTDTANGQCQSVQPSSVDRMRREAEEEMRRIELLYRQDNKDSSLGNRPILLSNRSQALDFLRGMNTVLFDCDGVLYRSPDPTPGAHECLVSLLQQNKTVYFVTNNAGTNRRELRDKLTSILRLDEDCDCDCAAKLNVDVYSGSGSMLSDGTSISRPRQQLKDEMMISSAYSAARYLQKQIANRKLGGRRLYVIGSQGLCDELKEAGFIVTGGGPTEAGVPASMTRDELAAYDMSLHHPIDAVVVGHDIDFTFRKLCIANVLLQWNIHAPLIATNEDAFDLVGTDARHIPGNGCVVKALEHSSKRTAVNVGKPSQILADLIKEECGESFDLSSTVIVGDRLGTDIRFGVRTGMHSLLVMTGVTTAAYLEQLQTGTESEPLPSHIMAHVGLFSYT